MRFECPSPRDHLVHATHEGCTESVSEKAVPRVCPSTAGNLSVREARALAAGIDAASQDARTRHECSYGGLQLEGGQLGAEERRAMGPGAAVQTLHGIHDARSIYQRNLGCYARSVDYSPWIDHPPEASVNPGIFFNFLITPLLYNFFCIYYI